MRLRRVLIVAFVVLTAVVVVLGGSREGSTEDALQGVWGLGSELRDTVTPGGLEGGWYVTPIHATLLPDGRVLLTGWERRGEKNCNDTNDREKSVTFLLEPDSVVNGNRIYITPIAENLVGPNDYGYCGGHTPMHDGKFFFAGGSYYERNPSEQPEWGLGYSRIFYRFGNNGAGEFYKTRAHNWQFVRHPELFANENSGRKWYPTATRLSTTGKILVTGGFFKYSHPPGQDTANQSIEIYTSGTDTWNTLVTDEQGLKEMTSAPIDYTHTFVLYKPVPRSSRHGNFYREHQVLMFGAYGIPLYFNVDEDGTDDRFAFASPRPSPKRTFEKSEEA